MIAKCCEIQRLEFEVPLEQDQQVCYNICQTELPISYLPHNHELHLELACVRGQDVLNLAYL